MVDRRHLLCAAGFGLSVAVAGCTSADESGQEVTDDGDGTEQQRATTTGDHSPTPSDGGADSDQVSEATATGTDSDRGQLDLREANVTAVAVDGADGSYRFDVTLYHDDGEDGYANWWQVETLGGDRLGRRELLHAHGTQEFTRSKTIAIPTDLTCVVVRGHDQTHGYGGQAALVDLPTGEWVTHHQGTEPRSFGDADCP